MNEIKSYMIILFISITSQMNNVKVKTKTKLYNKRRKGLRIAYVIE